MKRSFIVEHSIIYTIQKDTTFLCSDKQKIYGDKKNRFVQFEQRVVIFIDLSASLMEERARGGSIVQPEVDVYKTSALCCERVLLDT